MDHKSKLQEYCSSLSSYKRWPTREVMVGVVAVGKKKPNSHTVDDHNRYNGHRKYNKAIY